MTNSSQYSLEERERARNIELLDSLRKENRLQAVKLNILYAFIGVLRRGYDALLHHGVNYQSLPEYKMDRPLDDMRGKALSAAQSDAITWLGRLESAIAAAIRRKQFKVHDNPPPRNKRH
jgi:hypothetical protein